MGLVATGFANGDAVSMSATRIYGCGSLAVFSVAATDVVIMVVSTI